MEALTTNDTLFKGNFSTHDLLNYYQSWATSGKYDEHLSTDNGYRGPQVTAETAASLFHQNCRSTIKILDVAAGTGKVSEELRRFGFSDIDALDPSSAMLAQARLKNLYNNYICDFLHEYTMPSSTGMYDCITSSGGFGNGHIPAKALEDMIRFSKKGGYIVIAMREEYLNESCYHDILEPLMKKMSNENKWMMLQRRTIPDYAFGKTGLLYVFKVS